MNIYSIDEFLPLIEKAKLEIDKRKSFSGCQILVLQTSKGNLYHIFITEICTMCAPDQDIELIETLKRNDDSLVNKLICTWNGDSFVLPSYMFRKKLCEVNKGNKNTEMLLQGEVQIIKKTIAETF